MGNMQFCDWHLNDPLVRARHSEPLAEGRVNTQRRLADNPTLRAALDFCIQNAFAVNLLVVQKM
jgi:hypothetical protein